MRFTTSLLAGLLLTGILAIAPDTSFGRGGGGGGHFARGGHFAGGGGSHFGGFHGSFASHGFAHAGRGDAAWHHGGSWSHHGYGGYYGYYGPFYGLDNYDGYTYPYYDYDASVEGQPAPSEIAPQESTGRTMLVQRALTQLGYYHGAIDGIAGSETEQAIRWFQSVDKLPVTGQIDSETLQALRIG